MTTVPTILRARGHYDVRVAPGVNLLNVEVGLYKLLRDGRLLGWVERPAPGSSTWRSRLPEADRPLPETHPTRWAATQRLLNVHHPERAPAPWPVAPRGDGTWHVHCHRWPCPSVLAVAANNALEARIRAREVGWPVDDLGDVRCLLPHLFLAGGLS